MPVFANQVKSYFDRYEAEVVVTACPTDPDGQRFRAMLAVRSRKGGKTPFCGYPAPSITGVVRAIYLPEG